MQRIQVTPSPKKRVLVVGNTRQGEFAGPLRQLRFEAELAAFTTATAAYEWLAGNSENKPVVDQVVWLQSRPGEWTEREVALLRSIAPLAQFDVLLGSWCVGEMRSGRPLADVRRWYWHEWPPALKLEPVKLTSLGIYAWGRSDFEALAAALAHNAIHTTWLNPRQLPAVNDLQALVWHGRTGCATEAAEMAAVSLKYGRPHLVALFDFPHLEELERASQAGASVVLGKPCSMALLARHLHGSENAPAFRGI